MILTKVPYASLLKDDHIDYQLLRHADNEIDSLNIRIRLILLL
jgi:hypothetical protein